jgi:hypothetical protein
VSGRIRQISEDLKKCVENIVMWIVYLNSLWAAC